MYRNLSKWGGGLSKGVKEVKGATNEGHYRWRLKEAEDQRSVPKYGMMDTAHALARLGFGATESGSDYCAVA